MDNTSNFSDFEKMRLTPEIKGFLKETAKWGQFLAILGFIGIGLMILVGLFFGTFMSRIPGGNPYANLGSAGNYIGIMYVIISLFYFMPVFYLYKFSIKMKKALIENNEENLSDAFLNLKSHYKFIGVFALVILSIYLLMFIIGIFGAMFS